MPRDRDARDPLEAFKAIAHRAYVDAQGDVARAAWLIRQRVRLHPLRARIEEAAIEHAGRALLTGTDALPAAST